MRIATRVWVAAMAIAAVNLSANAAELSGPVAPAPAKEAARRRRRFGSSALCRWILAPRARPTPSRLLPQCGARQNLVTRRRRSMSRPCSTAAAARRATWRKPPSGMRGRPPAATVAPPSTSGSSMKAARACPPISICLAPGTPRPICRRPANAWRRPGLRADRPALVQAPEPLFPLEQNLACAWLATSRSRLDVASRTRGCTLLCRTPYPWRSRIRARSGAGLSTLAACACHSRRALRIWLGASPRWREVRRAILCPAGRSLRSLRLKQTCLGDLTDGDVRSDQLRTTCLPPTSRYPPRWSSDPCRSTSSRSSQHRSTGPRPR